MSSVTAPVATIFPAAVTVTAMSTNNDLGAPDPYFGVTYEGFVNGEDESVLGGTLVLTFSGVAPTSYDPSTNRPQNRAPTFFMRVMSRNSMDVAARAVAGMSSSLGCLYVLTTEAGKGLWNCEIYVNSDTFVETTAAVHADAINISRNQTGALMWLRRIRPANQRRRQLPAASSRQWPAAASYQPPEAARLRAGGRPLRLAGQSGCTHPRGVPPRARPVGPRRCDTMHTGRTDGGP